MKQLLRKYLVAKLACMSVLCAHAEAINHAWGDIYGPDIVSANTTDMIRYGEFGTSLFTGRMQQTIPIYTLDDPDFKMNIALHYNAEGFKPRKHSGNVGYNWFLEAGGCITREVNNFQDEIYGKKAGDEYERGVRGMYYFIAREYGYNVGKDEIFNLPEASPCKDDKYAFPYRSVYGCGDDYYTEYSPDIFHFDFMGYKGSFMINNAGKVQIISGDYVDVNLSGILTDWDPISIGYNVPCPKENSTITIKTTDGYTYVFGGDLTKLEYTVSAKNSEDFLGPASQVGGYTGNPPTVSAWHIAKIIAPNGRVMTFNYMSNRVVKEDNGTRQGGQDGPLWEYNEYFDSHGPYYHMQIGLCQEIMNNYIRSTRTQKQYEEWIDFVNLILPPYYFLQSKPYYWFSMTKSCVLESIQVSGEQPLKIVFSNSLEAKKMYDHSAYYRNCMQNYQLDAVSVISSGKTIKTANLSYDYSGRQGDGYSFNWRFLRSVSISGVGSYQLRYNTGTYPHLRDNKDTKGIVYDSNKGEVAETDDYGYYVSSYNIALLNKITYPTGGYQTYTYGPYAYDKKRKYSAVGSTNLVMTTDNETGTKRGARLQKVETFDENGQLVETKLYTYKNGIFCDNLRIYNLVFNLPLNKKEFGMWPRDGWMVRSETGYGNLSSHIGYGKVEETTTNSQGTYKTIYTFDMGEDSYDLSKDNNWKGYFLKNDFRNGLLSGSLLKDKELKKWGKLMSVETYDSNNKLLKSTSYEYNDVSSKMCTDTIVTFISFLGTDISKKLFIYPDVLIGEVVNEGGLTTTKTYSYDKKLRIARETTKDSRNTAYFSKYTYPDNICKTSTASDRPALAMLVESNRINIPVETLSGYVATGRDLVTKGTINLYTKEVTAKGTFPYLYQTLSLAINDPITNCQTMKVNGNNVTYDSRYKLDAEYKFNQQGRLLSVKPFGQMETTYSWNGIYPTRKTTGDQTWRYSFIPHVGVETITDPRGIVTKYEYDSAGRLIKESQVIDGQEQILNVYQYHIVTE